MYNEDEIMKMREYLRENYYRSLALGVVPEVDGLIYECKDEDIKVLQVSPMVHEAAVSPIFTHIAHDAFKGIHLKCLVWDIKEAYSSDV